MLKTKKFNKSPEQHHLEVRHFSKTECAICGYWHGEYLRKCPNCQQHNLDRPKRSSFMFGVSELNSKS